MKLGIVSDIHCNIRALRAAVAGMGDVDELFCAGDAVYGYRWSNEVMDLLRERGAHTVLGNHDHDFLKVHRERNGANGTITPENYEFVTNLPRTIEIEIGGRRIFMTHASPFDQDFEYIYPHSERFSRLAAVDADLFIYGHTHFSVAQQVGPVMVVNPGSIGEARDFRRPLLTYAVVDLATLETEIRDVDPADLTDCS